MRCLGVSALVVVAAVTGCGGGGSGGSWRQYAAPGTFDVTAVWAFAPDDVWAGAFGATGQPVILHFDGTAFTAVPTPPLGFVADFIGFAPDDLFAAGGSNLWHWNGATWLTVDFNGEINPSDLQSIWGTSRDDLWLGDGFNGQVHRWNGSSWTTTTTRVVQVTDLWGSSATDVYATGIFGMGHWTGSAWTEITDSVVDQASALWGFAANDIWAVGDFGTLAHWDGTAWADRLPAGNDSFEEDHVSVWGPAPDDVWAVGNFGAISHWDGAGWSQVQVGEFPFNPFLNKVHGSSASDVWVVGRTSDGSNTGVILHNEP